jgi:hypothetical protein
VQHDNPGDEDSYVSCHLLDLILRPLTIKSLSDGFAADWCRMTVQWTTPTFWNLSFSRLDNAPIDHHVSFDSLSLDYVGRILHTNTETRTKQYPIYSYCRSFYIYISLIIYCILHSTSVHIHTRTVPSCRFRPESYCSRDSLLYSTTGYSRCA